jgi:MFS transporter, NNP family, nitrate/nitrite transporter
VPSLVHAAFIEVANGFRRVDGGAFALFITGVQAMKFASVTTSFLFAAEPGTRAFVAVVWSPTTRSPAFIAFQSATTGFAHFASAGVSFAVRAGAAVAAAAPRESIRLLATRAEIVRIRSSVAPDFAAAHGATVAAMRLRAAAGGLALALTAGWSVANIGAVAGRIEEAYGVSLAVVGLFTTALFITHAAVQIPAGRLCDRYGARVVGMGGLAVAACASALALTWKQAAFAIAMRFVAGIGTGLSFVAGSDYIRATIGTAYAQGLYGAGSMLGGGLALVLVPLWGGWQAPFASAAILATVGIAVLAAAPRTGARPLRSTQLPSIRDRRLLRLAAMHSASFGLSVVLANWVATLVERHDDASTELAGVAAGLTLLLGIVTRPAGGRAYGNATLLRASFLAGGAGTALLAFTSELGVAVAAAALVGLAAGIPFASAFTDAARVRPDAPGAAIGLVNMAAALTVLVGTPLVGLSFSLPGDGRLGFAVVAALWAAASLAVARAGIAERAPLRR